MDAFYKYSPDKEELLIRKLQELSGKSNLDFMIERQVNEEDDANYKEIIGIALKDYRGKRGRVILLWKHVNETTVKIEELDLKRVLKTNYNLFVGAGTLLALFAGGPVTFLAGAGSTVFGIKGKINEKAFNKHIHSIITDIFELEEIQSI